MGAGAGAVEERKIGNKKLNVKVHLASTFLAESGRESYGL